MNYNTNAQEAIIKELVEARIDIEFSGESFIGYPIPVPNFLDVTEEDVANPLHKGKYQIIEVEPNKHGMIFNNFMPYSISVNDKFNSPLDLPFYADKNYGPYFQELVDKLISEIDVNINQRENVWSILDYLTRLRLELKEIKANYSLIKDMHIEFDNSPFYSNANVNLNVIGNDEFAPYEAKYVYFTLSGYWEIQLGGLDRIMKTLDVNTKNIKRSDDYVLEKSKLAQSYKLVWTKSDTDLLELIIALYEHGAIQNSTNDLTQKEAIQAFSGLFDKEIKDQYKKLNAARARKKEAVPAFLSKVQGSLETYYERQESKGN